MRRIFTLLLASISLIATAQERCGTEAHTKNLMSNNANYATARDKVNAQTEKWIENHPNHSEKTIITIPVVVHVVWKTNQENISNAQIESQIEILNADFGRTNIDAINTPSVWQGIAADSEIQFCLAETDPNGNTTTGITRTETTVSQFSMWGGSSVEDASDGGIDAWPNDDYLNIWICNLGGNLLGYASPPSNWISSNDGVVVNYPNFGLSGNSNAPYHKGRTATHEVGHWLNLEHIWGDSDCGDDNVNDTPTQVQDNYSCPGFPLVSICDDPQTVGIIEDNAPNGDMFMNYMDYVNDACMNLFTTGQKDRMRSAINLYRSNMTTNNCDGSVGVIDHKNNNRKLIKIVDVLGRTSTEKQRNTPLFYIYDNGSVEKKIITE